MQKKILLAVDNTRPSRNVIRYAVYMSSLVKQLHYVLFHVQPMLSLILMEEAQKSAKARKQLDKALKQNDTSARKLIDDCQDEMVKMGIAPDRIQGVTQKRSLGFAKDILEFGQKQRYDAIVVGRRGLSRLAEMYAGSVTTDILEQSQVIPVWLVDSKVRAGGILVAVDGSEASLRAVDHTSFILSDNPDVSLTLLHVTGDARNYEDIQLQGQPSPELAEIIARGSKTRVDQFYAHAITKFKDAGLAEDRIKMETLQARRRIGKVILDFAHKGNFSTVVVGRRGINKSFFMGSASRYMINRLNNRALWVVP